MATVWGWMNYALFLFELFCECLSVSGYQSVNLARHHPAWIMRDNGINETAAVLVDGDTHTCSNVNQTFWAVDLGFNVAVDDVTIVSSNFEGNIIFAIKIEHVLPGTICNWKNFAMHHI